MSRPDLNSPLLWRSFVDYVVKRVALQVEFIHNHSDFLNMSFFVMFRCRWCSVQNGSPTSFPLRMSSCSCFSGRENHVQCKRPPGLILTCRSTGGFVSAAPNLVNYLFQSGLFLHKTPAALHNVDQITRRQTLSLKHWKWRTGAQGTWKRA